MTALAHALRQLRWHFHLRRAEAAVRRAEEQIDCANRHRKKAKAVRPALR